MLREKKAGESQAEGKSDSRIQAKGETGAKGIYNTVHAARERTGWRGR
jgi:hypothetical protein